MSKKIVSLALQGGGSHGAFTWGVLDRLLEDERIEIGAISGSSAGAMNAVVLAAGLTCGGPEGARAALRDFWSAVSSPETFSASASAVSDDTLGAAGPMLKAFLFMTRFFSPYQLNPFDVNPLRDILERQIDFARLRAECPISLFVAATRVSTGRLRLFRTGELTLDVLLASACLPNLHHSIEIDGHAYWDGGLSANPPLFPLLDLGLSDDMILVLLHSTVDEKTPSAADEIARRLGEIGFSSAFFAELQGLTLMKQDADRAWLRLGRRHRNLRRLNTHLIDAPDYMGRLDALSKASTHTAFIAALYEEGRARAAAWLLENFDLIGVRSSRRLDAMLA
jgi:NTE family protein